MPIGSFLKPGHASRPIADDGPLFAPAYNPEADAIGSYNDAVRAVGERVKAGEPVPEFFLSGKP